MKVIVEFLVIGIWAFAFYLMGYVNAQINERSKRIKEICRDIERRLDKVHESLQETDKILKRVSDNNEENVNRHRDI